MDREFKTSARGIEVKDEGVMTAVFATFDVIDLDGDVVSKDAFKSAGDIVVSAYNHASWGPGELPVGRGTVRTTDSQALVDVQFIRSTKAGEETFQTLKEIADLAQFSWGFDVIKSHPEERDGREVRVLDEVALHEVSPVLRGASINTGIVSIKGRLDFMEHAALCGDGVSEFVDRARKRHEALLKAGRMFSEANLEKMAGVESVLRDAADELAALRSLADPKSQEFDLAKLIEEFEIQGAQLPF